RPALPAVTHGMTLLPRSGGETVNGPRQVLAPSVETASLIAPGPFSVSVVPNTSCWMSSGYSDQTTYTSPAWSSAIDANRLPLVCLPSGRAGESCQFTFTWPRSWLNWLGSVQSAATVAAVLSPALPRHRLTM